MRYCSVCVDSKAHEPCFVPGESDEPCLKCKLRGVVQAEAKASCETVRRGKKRKRKTEVERLRESYFFPDTFPDELTYITDIHLSRKLYSDTDCIPVKRSWRILTKHTNPRETLPLDVPGSTVIG